MFFYNFRIISGNSCSTSVGVSPTTKTALKTSSRSFFNTQNSYFQLFSTESPRFWHRFITASFPAIQGTNSGRCTIYVQYLYNICTFTNCTTIVQLLYIYWTTTSVGRAEIGWRTEFFFAALRFFSIFAFCLYNIKSRYEKTPFAADSGYVSCFKR